MKLSHPASRRNSFAGMPPKVKINSIPISPPAIPMRPKIIPTPIMTVNSNQIMTMTSNKAYQHSTQTQDQTVHAQRVILQKHNSVPDQMLYNAQEMSPTRTVVMQGRASDTRLSVRKRAHNSSSSKDCNGSYIVQQTPPPIKPRMRNQNESNGNNIQTQQQQQNVFMPIVANNNNKVR
jgi:hypothetical protein